jgi:hypothetical protein
VGIGFIGVSEARGGVSGVTAVLWCGRGEKQGWGGLRCRFYCKVAINF